MRRRWPPQRTKRGNSSLPITRLGLCCALRMQWVPTSMLVYAGDDAKIHCNFEQEKNEVVEVSWHLIHRTMNMTSSPTYSETRQTNLSATTKILSIPNTKKSDSGLYQCRVTARGRSLWSCGTYLRVRDPPVYLFFNVAEATKNRLITAEGIILMLCAIIPGSLLLYKKRMENLNSMSLKEAEGENLYEGLNLEDCSMYEDISRGLQATYEDVGTLRASDIQLEKP
ncbi:B-cell antigen receptor complex-associated protein alpha chain isoform X3 [Engystomops pustulosus]|uniref:B-cell antigen receptor complex-associated protein alpha chain isoform X3 n=1 Tax=Engystomops pustulosus TaxID=76066 RepID=UPI003AFB3EA6